MSATRTPTSGRLMNSSTASKSAGGYDGRLASYWTAAELNE
jgi:hypothetical protein